MGCCQAQAAGGNVVQTREKTFGPPTSYPSTLHETAQEETGCPKVSSDTSPGRPLAGSTVADAEARDEGASSASPEQAGSSKLHDSAKEEEGSAQGTDQALVGSDATPAIAWERALAPMAATSVEEPTGSDHEQASDLDKDREDDAPQGDQEQDRQSAENGGEDDMASKDQDVLDAEAPSMNIALEGHVSKKGLGHVAQVTLKELFSGSAHHDMQGTVFAFGSNQFGQLGVGRPAVGAAGAEKVELPDGSTSWTSNDLWWSSRPVRVMALRAARISDLACGENHCVAVDTQGQLYAWGSNVHGEIGEAQQNLVKSSLQQQGQGAAKPTSAEGGGNGEEAEGAADVAVHLPVPISLPHLSYGRLRFMTVACGAEFSLAVDSMGDIWAWGSGDGGVLGLGPEGFRGAKWPLRIDSLSSIACSSVTCGSYHAMALSRSGLLFSWGRAEGGQLGLSEETINGHIEAFELEDTCVCKPQKVDFSFSNSTIMDVMVTVEKGAPIKQVACGEVHSLALDADGQVWSWGWGEFGQLGLGFTGASFELGQGGMSSKRLTPVALELDHFASMRVRFIACGGAFSAALGEVGGASGVETGNLFLWGANEVGQCALPPKKPLEIDVPTRVSALMHVVVRSIACGTAHAVAVDSMGRAYSWGACQKGQLGNSVPSMYFSSPLGSESGARDPIADPAQQETLYQPTFIQCLSELRIMKAACGLHHTLLVSEVEPDN